MNTFHEPIPGRAHWVYTHPRQDSLNRHLLRAGSSALAERYDVTVSDLYTQGFDPALSDRDLGSLSTVAGNVAGLAGEAYARGEVEPEVRREQESLAASELLILQFPLWWYGPPAMLKGWFDRVLQTGFAQGETDEDSGLPRRYGDGRLLGRKALLIVTTGDDQRTLGPRGVSGDLESLLFPLTHGALWYVGIEALDLHVVYNADGIGGAGREHEGRRLAERLRGVSSEPTRRYRKMLGGDYDRATRALVNTVNPGRTDLAIHLSD
ncbi:MULTISPECIES: NAD(P)H-dependent oxidoreductase [Brevibacterium]|uniref:NAD(P)H dehydrogenase (Quinone) n=1 Tax=Brevibacterium aurantiacum TaxID=273384 RepID=A0A2H1ILD6_BREAU|nr:MULTISPECIES: NAD(P)H-dependent oxidoreductase [Brevibacterium]SMX76025.1 NAD(P)H dehydrogenase (quinone) [Brevibacterium aurantiacum]